MKKKTKKLTLARETLRSLEALANAKGGTLQYSDPGVCEGGGGSDATNCAAGSGCGYICVIEGW